jgi:hypothetical protein
VASNKPTPINILTPHIRNFGQEKGGRELVDGWQPEDWGSIGEYLRESFDNETFVHSSFNSVQEAVKFMSGIGKYSDRNSFFYNPQDYQEFQQEGFFQSVQCPDCLEDLRSQLEGESIPEDEIVDPEIQPGETEYQTKSFKPDEEKYVKKIWYRCREHPEVSLMKTETWYE